MTDRSAAAVFTRRRALTAVAAFAGGAGGVSAGSRGGWGCVGGGVGGPRGGGAPLPPAEAATAAKPATRGRPQAGSAPQNVYSQTAPGKLNPRWARDTVRVYVPN